MSLRVPALALLVALRASPSPAEPIEIRWDGHGIPHIYAETELDAVYAQGWCHARDRLFAMDLFRHFARGTLAELVGEEALEDDRYQRVVGLTRVAAEIWASLSPETADFLEAYAAGVNARLVDMGPLDLPIEYRALGLGIADVGPWEPLDSIVIARLQTQLLAFDIGDDFSLAERLDAFRESYGFHGGPDSRAGLPEDLFRFTPRVPATHMDGFPQAARGGDAAPTLPSDRSFDANLLARARAALRPGPWHRRLRAAAGGSNAWVVAGATTRSGAPILANDPHVDLSAPPLLYLAHLNTKRGGGAAFNASGASTPGVPGILLGHNEHIAWGTTLSQLDATNTYIETVFPGAGDDPDSVLFEGNAIAMEERTEILRVRDPETGEISETPFLVQVVPHHGPVLDGSNDGASAISFRWTGLEATREIEAFRLVHGIDNLEDFIDNIFLFDVGSQSLVYCDVAGNIYYNSYNAIPLRSAAGMTRRYPPNLPYPGTGAFEWVGLIPPPKLPQELNPERGYVVTANNDPVGVTLDNNPFNDEYYIGDIFDIGFRAGRIEELLLERLGDLTVVDMQRIQADGRSALGGVLLPHLEDAIDQLGIEDPLALEAWDLLRDWDLRTPAGTGWLVGEDERRSSVATSIFTAWLTRFFPAVALDEYEHAEVGFMSGNGSTLGVRGLLFIIEHPEQTYTGDAIFDRIGTPEIETRQEIFVSAFEEAVDFLAGAFGSEDIDRWRWGKLHRVRFAALSGVDLLSIPSTANPLFPEGYPRGGDNYTVDACDFGIRGDEFGYDDGPGMRFVVRMEEGKIAAWNVLPGGQSGRAFHPHYRDLAQQWRHNEAVRIPFYYSEVFWATRHVTRL